MDDSNTSASSPPSGPPTEAEDTFSRLRAKIDLPHRVDLKNYVVREAGPYRAALRSCLRRDRSRRVWPAIIEDIEQQLQIDLTGRHRTVATYLSSDEARASAMAWERARSSKDSSSGPEGMSSAGLTTRNPFLGKR